MADNVSSDSQYPPERRKGARIKTCFTVAFTLSKNVEMKMQVKDKEVSAIMMDLSQYGMAILTSENIPPATKLFMQFTLINEFESKSNQTRVIEIEGEVKNSTSLEEKNYRVGIVFSNLSDEDSYIIGNFVRRTKAWDPSA